MPRLAARSCECDNTLPLSSVRIPAIGSRSESVCGITLDSRGIDGLSVVRRVDDAQAAYGYAGVEGHHTLIRTLVEDGMANARGAICVRYQHLEPRRKGRATEPRSR